MQFHIEVWVDNPRVAEVQRIGSWPTNLDGLTACTLSIQKWECIEDWLSKHPAVKLYDGGQQTCALCYLFWSEESCENCPVAKETGAGWCHGTPYQKYARDRTAENARRERGFLELIRDKVAEEKP